MTTFVDTSALFALLDRDDPNNTAATEWFDGPGRDPDQTLVTHSYVLVESAALVQSRLGSQATATLLEGLIPALSVIYVDERLHHAAQSAFLASLGRRTSFVDRVSFEMMHDLGIQQVFAFDRDFSREGFETVP